VGEQGHLAGPLDGGRDLHLVTAADAGGVPRADATLVGDEAAQGRGVFEVDLLDPGAVVLWWSP
jgi:hypothetical protein